MEATETPMRDHIAEFWRLLETEHVRILVNTRRQTEAMTYYDSSSFSDDVAKALVADRAAIPSPTGEKVEACEHDWEKTREDLCMFVCAKCQQAFSGNVISDTPTGWTGKYQSRHSVAAHPSPTGEKVEAVAVASLWLVKNVHGEIVGSFPTMEDALETDGGLWEGDTATEWFSAETVAALVAERDDLATKWQQAIAIGMLHADRATTAESALATANARVEKMERAGKFLANAAENFACRFTMNSLAEDDDRQRQAVLDQTRLFRAALTGGENG